jgi:hypothetical protein
LEVLTGFSPTRRTEGKVGGNGRRRGEGVEKECIRGYRVETRQSVKEGDEEK